MIRTFGAAVGAVLVILFLATVASKLAARSEPVAQESALRR